MEIADLQNSSKWSLVYSVSVEAERTSSVTFRPIPKIIIPYTMNSRLIASYADSNNAPDRWFSAGYIQKEISVGIEVGNNQNTKLDFSRRVPLRKAFVFQPLSFGENYKLVFLPHKWFDQISLQIWEYTGDIKEDLSEDIEVARIDILRIEKKVNLIIQQSI